jgi:hypothetical protein
VKYDASGNNDPSESKMIVCSSSDARTSSRFASNSAYPPIGIKRYGTSSWRNREASIRAASRPSYVVSGILLVHQPNLLHPLHTE